MSEKKFVMKELKSKALETLKGRWKPMVLATLVYILIGGLISVLSSTGKNPANGFSGFLMVKTLVAIALSFLVTPLLQMAYVRFAIKFANTNENLDVSEMFSLANPYKPSYAIYWANFLKVFLWMLPLFVIIVLCSVLSIAMSYTESETTAFIIGLSVLVVAYVAYLVFLCKKIISYSFSCYIVAEDPSVKAFDAIRQSVELTKGSCGRIFLFCLSFIGWGLLAGVTFGIGLLWLLPYIQLSYYNLYKELSVKA